MICTVFAQAFSTFLHSPLRARGRSGCVSAVHQSIGSSRNGNSYDCQPDRLLSAVRGEAAGPRARKLKKALIRKPNVNRVEANFPSRQRRAQVFRYLSHVDICFFRSSFSYSGRTAPASTARALFPLTRAAGSLSSSSLFTFLPPHSFIYFVFPLFAPS